MSEKFSSGTKNPNKPTNIICFFFKRENQSTQRYQRGKVHIRGFCIEYSERTFLYTVHIYTEIAITKNGIRNFILSRVYKELEAKIKDCTESGLHKTYVVSLLFSFF